MSPSETRKLGPVARCIELCAKNPWLTLLAVALMGVWGWKSLQNTALDAIPDTSDVQVIVLTEWPGQSPELIEDQLTYPITSTLLSAPKVRSVRGMSFFGSSFVYAIFEDGTDLYWARSRVLEYLETVKSRLPEGARPTLGPDATGVGWVYQYALVDEGKRHDLAELRSLQDWNIRFALESLPGVAEVASIGGFRKEYQVSLDPERMKARGVSVADVVRAVRESNAELGGRTLEIAGHEYMVRGRGWIRTSEDVGAAPVAMGPSGTPVRVSDVADVTLGPAERMGFADLDGKGEVVGGIVVMRHGENALKVIESVKARMAELEKSLPEGVKFVTTYDRSELIEASIDTLKTTIVEEMIVVSLIIFVFLLHARSALVPVLTLPLAVLLAFIPMVHQGLTANIMSLGGIAVAIGAMVDASIILIENVHKKLEEWEEAGRPGSRLEAMIRAMQEVGPSIFFSLLVITVSFLPVFVLAGSEGRMFKPLAYTKTYSMGFAAVLAVTATPALVALLIRGKIRPEDHNPINRWLVRLYVPVVRFVVRHRVGVIVFSVLAMIVTVPAFLRLGREFMPPLNEGAILYMPSSTPGMSATEAAKVLQSMDRELATIPEVTRVFGKVGRADTATDPAPMSMLETTVLLKPRGEWRDGLTWDALVAEMDEKVRFPGMPNVWWMPIQTRTEMLATGIRSELGVKVYGDSLQEIEKVSVEIEKILQEVPGTRSAFAERATGGFYLDIEVNRKLAARHGLSVAEVNESVMSAVGGMQVTEAIEGRERYSVLVRYARDFRESPEALSEVLVPTPSGAQVPLSELAELRYRMGPPMISSEAGKLLGIVFVNLDGVPVADYVEEAKALVESKVSLPSGVRLEWAGQYTYYERARETLAQIIPLTLLLVVLLLWFNTRSLMETFIVLLAVPFSLIGAVWLLYFLDYDTSVAVWVGIIALAGLDAETGVVMLLYLTLSWKKHEKEGRLQSFADLEEAIVEGAARRIRPKLMTVLTTMIGLIPVLWSDGVGADVMKRIAAPMVGGLVSSFLLELTVYPAIFALWKGRALPKNTPSTLPATTGEELST